MKRFIHSFILFAFALLIVGCEQTSLQKQVDKKFGTYVEVVSPENLAFYEAYNKALGLWGTDYGEVSIHTKFGKAHVLVSGPENGEAIVLLHGLNASSTMWYPNIKALAEHHRVYAIDFFLEPGKSEQLGKVGNMEEILSWYNEVFMGLKLQEFSLIGVSRGGWLAVNIALQHKYNIKNMVLLSPAQTFVLIPPNSAMLANIIYSLNPERENLRATLETMSTNVDNIEQVYIEQYFIATQKASLDKFILQMIPYSNDEVCSLNMPVLLLIGDHDIINDEKSIDKAKKLLPHVSTGIIKNAGHFLSCDQAKIVNTKICEFLNTKSAEAKVIP